MKNRVIPIPLHECIFLLFTILASGTLFTTDHPHALYGIVLVFCYMLFTRKFILKHEMIRVISILVLMTILSIVQNVIFTEGDGIVLTLKNYALVIISVLFAMNHPVRNNDRLDFLAKSILITSLISNLVFLKILMSGNFDLAQSSTSETMHYHYLVSIAGNALSGFEIRNGGIYWEPGMYQVYLTLLLWYFLYKPNQKYRWLIIAYLIFATITTFSVSGYATMIAIIGIYVIRNDKAVIVKLFLMIIAALALVYVMPVLQDSKEKKEKTTSAEARGNDLTLGFDVFMTSPIVGYGIVNKEYNKASKQKLQVERQCSNGLMNFLIQTGLLGLSLVLIGILGFVKWSSVLLSSKMPLAILAWYAISINTEPITLQPVLCFLMGIGVAYFSRKKKAPKAIAPISRQTVILEH